MPEHPVLDDPRPRLSEIFDDAGRAWLDEVLRAVKDGGYTELRDAFLADEDAVHGHDGDRRRPSRPCRHHRIGGQRGSSAAAAPPTSMPAFRRRCISGWYRRCTSRRRAAYPAR